MSSAIKTLQQFRLQYTLVSHIGDGGYGSVFVCEDLKTGQQRAVKTMEDKRCKNRTYCPLRRTSLPNEIVLWEHLSHPNIPALVDFFFCSETRRWYIVMEYEPEFEDLFNHIDRVGSLSSTDAANLIRQLVQVVYYLTRNNIDHRDLKDENILYNPTTKQIKLIDFGSSAHLSPDPYTSFRGTDVYIPPEFYLRKQYYSFAATTWSIGCIAYILLAGDCPFQSVAQITEFKQLEDLKHELGGRTTRLNFIRSCMAPDPDNRALLSDLILHPWLKR